jgi:RNA ligase (TIGR02306 family)
MSTHEVKVVRIESILPHPNADALELTNVWGYQCVIRKGEHKVGDLMVFIEPDYTVPLDRNEFKFLDDGKGKSRQRITMRRFRGEPSYGLLIPAPEGSVEGDNLMEQLGVERYEPPAPKGSGMLTGIQASGPSIAIPAYDLENFRKFHRMFHEGERVILTEKIHGTNGRYLYMDGEMHCGSRTTWKMKPGTHVKDVTWTDENGVETTKTIIAPECVWWTALAQNPWIEEWCRNHPGLAIYGEVYGPSIQGSDFHYGKNQGQYGFAAFDVLDHGRWIDNAELFDNPIYSDGLLETVRVLYRGPLDNATLEKLAEEDSCYPNQKVREGVVVKLERKERFNSKYGRVALKYVSDRYLCMK